MKKCILIAVLALGSTLAIAGNNSNIGILNFSHAPVTCTAKGVSHTAGPVGSQTMAIQFPHSDLGSTIQCVSGKSVPYNRTLDATFFTWSMNKLHIIYG